MVWSHLHIAACSGNITNVIDLVSGIDADPVSVDIRDATGWTPLMMACLHNRFPTVDFLLSKKADPNITNRSGATALHLATKQGFDDIVELLIKAGAEVNAINPSNGRTALHEATQSASVKCVQLLLNAKSSMNVFCNDGLTPLHSAAEKGNWESFLVLIDNGCSIEAKDKRNRTPLECAESDYFIERLREILVQKTMNEKETEYRTYIADYVGAVTKKGR